MLIVYGSFVIICLCNIVDRKALWAVFVLLVALLENSGRRRASIGMSAGTGPIDFSWRRKEQLKTLRAYSPGWGKQGTKINPE